MADPNGRSSTATVDSNVDQAQGNSNIEINNPNAARDPSVMAHELTHVWQNNLPPATQARIPDDPKDMSAFDISDVNKLRAQGKTLVDLPREKQATIVQKYVSTKDPKVKAQLKPWIVDMQRTPLSSTQPTANNQPKTQLGQWVQSAKDLVSTPTINTTPRAHGRPDSTVAGAYPSK
jgi:hypothetical protein